MCPCPERKHRHHKLAEFSGHKEIVTVLELSGGPYSDDGNDNKV
jgi:hypothetical protein